MHKVSKVEEFKEAKLLLDADVYTVLSQQYEIDKADSTFTDEDGEGVIQVKTQDERIEEFSAEMQEAVKDKQAVLEDLRNLEPLAALEECREAVTVAGQIAEGVDTEAHFEIQLDYMRVENMKPAYAEEARKLSAKCEPILAKLDKSLEELAERIEAVKGRVKKDPIKVEKLESLKQWREVAIVEGRDTSEVDAEITELKNAMKADDKVFSLAKEEADILSRHAKKIQSRRDSVADIHAHIEAVSNALMAFQMAGELNEAAATMAAMAETFFGLKERVAKAPGNIRTPGCQRVPYRFSIPRLEGHAGKIDDKGNMGADYWLGSNEGTYAARVNGN